MALRCTWIPLNRTIPWARDRAGIQSAHTLSLSADQRLFFHHNTHPEYETIVSNICSRQIIRMLRGYQRSPEVDRGARVWVQKGFAHLAARVESHYRTRLNVDCLDLERLFSVPYTISLIRVCFSHFFSICDSVKPCSSSVHVTLYSSMGMWINQFLHKLYALVEGAEWYPLCATARSAA